MTMKAKDEVKRKLESLPVRLTQDELNQRAKRLTEAVQEIDENDAWKKACMREHKDKDETLQGEVRRLSRIVNSGEEYRQVECEEVPNWKKGTMETYRMDTGECVDFRPMSTAEKQAQFEFGDGSESVN